MVVNSLLDVGWKYQLLYDVIKYMFRANCTPRRRVEFIFELTIASL